MYDNTVKEIIEAIKTMPYYPNNRKGDKIANNNAMCRIIKTQTIIIKERPAIFNPFLQTLLPNYKIRSKFAFPSIQIY